MENPEIPFRSHLPSDWTFFGLTPRYKVYKQEQIFDLVYFGKGGFSYTEIYNMPVYLRTFYIKRLESIHAEQKKEHEKAMKQAKSRSKAPSKVPKKAPKFRR